MLRPLRLAVSFLSLVALIAWALPAWAQSPQALQFNSASSQYVTFGGSTALGAATFTVEIRFKRSGAGIATSTGTGGINAIPLITKGRAQADGNNQDCNYFLGIDGATGRLAADFEDTTLSNNNHPLFGTTTILNDVWYHAAVTFDGTNFRIYLDGNLEGTVTSAAKPRYDSIQHAGLGSAMTSTGAAAGFFTGILDEARVWNVARSQAQIQADMNLEVLSGSGLIGRWGLNEGTGTTAGNSVGSLNGALTPAGTPPLWTTDSAVPLSTAAGLRFGGTNGYVTFGNASALGLQSFTVETWFRRDGPGLTTGTGAITAVPLVTKGRGQADGSNVDMNYFLGIDGTTGRLVADFEDFTASNNNHPLSGTTTITNGVWYHGAITYDGANFKIYVNGNLEGSVATTAIPRYDSIQHAGLATGLNSTGVADGFLNGALDEVRIWNFARTQAEIISTINSALTGPESGLIARWGLNEDAQTTVASSAGTALNGTITGSNWSWAAGSSFNATPPSLPANPTSLSAFAVSSTQIDLSWTDNASDETGYEVERSTSGAGGPFTLLITLAANSTVYSNTDLNASTEYCYRVRAVNGALASNYAGPVCATTLDPSPPAEPTDLVATAPTYGQVHLTWVDHASDETGFELERSTTGNGGPYTLLASLTANTTVYDDLNRNAGTEYCYRVRAVNGALASAYAGPSCVTTPAASSTGLDFGSAGNTYAMFGNPAALQLSMFTIELWLRRDGTGLGTDTGSLGIPNLVPLVAKGRAEAEEALKDINYIFGIRASDGVLCADFEEGAGGTNPSRNHPVIGSTPIPLGSWHHAAATYDGTTWKLYLDGNLETTLAVGQPVASGSAVVVSLASALNSSGTASGFFNGVVDEVRIWSVARTQAQIQATANSAIVSPIADLVARWSLDEGSGAILNASAGTTPDGSIVNSDYTWTTPGAPFDLVFTPTAPSNLAANAVSQSEIGLTWSDNSGNETGFEIERSTTGTGGPFSPLTTVSANTTSYADQGLSPSTEYCYQVRAVNGSGPSGYAGPVCATTLIVTPTYTLTTSVDPAGTGTIARNPDLASYAEGSTVELTALPDTGYHFVNWTGDLTGSENPDTLIMGADKSVVAHFAVDTFTITATTGTGGTIAPSGAVVVNYGADQTFTITPAAGYQIATVFVDGDSLTAVPSYTFTGVTSDHTIHATFALIPDALAFTGTNGYVNFGNPGELKLPAFTIEMWARRDGAGVGTDTGSQGIPDLIPLLAKGRADVEDPLRDINYIVGIKASTGVLAADFEEAGAPSPNPSLNHPVLGKTPLAVGTWYHLAATYDGTTWRLYVNGASDTSLVVGRTPATASNVAVSLASALNLAGTASGFFNGHVDEVRIWNVARSQAQIAATINQRLSSPTTGLVARWGLDEGSGNTVQSTAGTTINGTITGTGWSWTIGAPFNATPPTPPAAPTDLAASPTADTQISLAWTDNASDETGFEIERSTAGIGGPYSFLATVPANTSNYLDTGLNPSTQYCYQVRAVNDAGPSAYAGPACTTTSAPPTSALSFTGNTYVTFGDPAALDLPQFTIECWFRRDGTGTTTSTGSGGITNAIPLVTHGASQTDGSNVDENFFLGIRSSDGVLCADFEEGAAGPSPGLNHPVIGVTPVGMGVWHHAAATYDGTTWNLYLDGSLETTLAVGRPPRFDTIQHAALASSLTSTGAPQGFLHGTLDEVRIWNFARSGGQIQSDANAQIATPQSGLVARWSLDEGTGTAVDGSAGTAVNGTVTGAGFAWTNGAPFNLTFTAPAAPTGLAASPSSSTEISLSWTDNSTNETGFEIERSTTGIGGPFSPLITLPANAVSYTDQGLSASTQYCYQVRAVNNVGPSTYAGPECATTPAVTTRALSFSGNTYVTFGDPTALDLPQFTIECWFRRDGTGTTTSTGSGGIADAIPLVTHGRSQSDGSNVDANFFLGIRNSDGVLCADFEEGAAGPSPGLNHPVIGVTPVGTGLWHHAAATYDGTSWNLYLDGNLEATLSVGRPPRSDTIQHAALASALNSTGVAAGFFVGVLDEVRIWNVARTSGQVQTDINNQIVTPQSGLVARWGLDEGTGTAVNGSAGTAVNGAITGSAYAWVSPAPFNLTFTAPAAPSGLSANAASHDLIQLNWTDNSNNESSFGVERSTSGIGGPFSPLATVAANQTAYADATVSALTEYCYRVRAVNGFGASSYAGPICATTPEVSSPALDLAGNTYVGFSNPAILQLSTFTIELWLRRDGPGVGTDTGSQGIPNAIPLIAKGRAESEAAAVDLNYIFGIRASDGVLCADFEEGPAGASPSLNHPIFGSTPITTGSWHHAAVSYDGTVWKLYLDGNLEASLDVGQPVASASTVPVALGSALNSSGVASGFFDGVVDEVRIWNVERTQEQIQSAANIQLTTPSSGLIARWALDEGSGTAVNGSAGTTVNGTIVGAAYSWVSGAPFNLSFNRSPSIPVLVGPANDEMDVITSPTLRVTVSDPDSDAVTVSYYGRPATASAAPDFTIIGLPDTQYYTGQVNGGTNAIFLSQTNWIVANRAPRNIVYVTQLGDCVENGDNNGNDIEWQRADAALSIIENPVTTELPEGIPYGVCVGNHDQSPIGNPDGTTTFYNQYFGVGRFGSRSYYGGHYGANNDNWYDLFSASGMDFIAISFEYDTTPDAAVLSWADALLTTYSNRRAILMSHFFCNTGNPASFGTQGQATYNALRGHPNLFLMLCGHVAGEGRRQDTFNGNTVHTLLSDYQGRANGGNGWLRIMEFSPANNVIRVKTYSPWLDQYEADADSSSQFTLPYNMSSGQPFTLIGTAENVPSGSISTMPWPGLSTSTPYEWYVTVSDGVSTVTSPTWSFTTRPTHTISARASQGGIINPEGEVPVSPGTDQTFNFTPNPGHFLTNVMVDGVPQGAVTSYTFPSVSADHTIQAVFSDPTGIESPIPAALVFTGVSPNPAHRRADIRFGLPHDDQVRLEIYDVSGRRVATVADRRFEPGYHELQWAGSSDVGPVPSGVYFLRFSAGQAVMTRRFVLVR